MKTSRVCSRQKNQFKVIDKATTSQSAITNNVTVVTPLNLGQVIKRQAFE